MARVDDDGHLRRHGDAQPVVGVRDREQAVVVDGVVGCSTGRCRRSRSHRAPARSRAASRRSWWCGSPRMVKVADWPGATLVTSASEICALITMVSRSAILTMVGAVWVALTLWPSVTSTATMVPPMGAVICGALEVELGAVDGELGLADLGVERGDGGLGGGEPRLGGQQIGVGDELLRREFLGAIERGLGGGEIGLLGLQLRLHVGERGLGRAARRSAGWSSRSWRSGRPS